MSIESFTQWLSTKVQGRAIAKPFYWLLDKYYKLCGIQDEVASRLKGVKMLRIGIVGDLSMQDPQRLRHAMQEANANSHIVINVGDVHPAYGVMKEFLFTNGVRNENVLVVPGNHDENYDSMGVPRNWIKFYESVNCVIVGIDNSEDKISKYAWDLLEQAKQNYINNTTQAGAVNLIVVTHKPLSTLLLPDGSENNHIMADNDDRVRLIKWLDQFKNTLLVCGHFHSWTYQRTSYSDVLVEGRGGSSGPAGAGLGWTSIIVTNEGWIFRKIDL